MTATMMTTMDDPIKMGYCFKTSVTLSNSDLCLRRIERATGLTVLRESCSLPLALAAGFFGRGDFFGDTVGALTTASLGFASAFSCT